MRVFASRAARRAEPLEDIFLPFRENHKNRMKYLPRTLEYYFICVGVIIVIFFSSFEKNAKDILICIKISVSLSSVQVETLGDLVN